MSAFIRVTAWEKASPGRRVLGAFVRVFMLFALLAVLGFIYHANRFRLAAQTWHWRHGYSAAMGNYEVPVPEHWLILGDDSVAFTLMNTSQARPPRDGKLHTAAVITVFPFRNWPAEAKRADSWLSFKRQWLAREDVKAVEETTVKFGNDSIICVGGRELSAVLRNASNVSASETDIVSLDCMSERGLEVLFVGEPSDLEPFYTFLSQIRSQR
jgi:hypothetical protein